MVTRPSGEHGSHANSGSDLVEVADRVVRVVIVDDAPSARRWLRAILDSSPMFEVVGEAASGKSALSIVDAVDPDLVCMDVRLPDEDASVFIDALSAGHPDRKIVLVTGGEFADSKDPPLGGRFAVVSKGTRPLKALALLHSAAGLSPDERFDIQRDSNDQCPHGTNRKPVGRNG